MEAIKPVSRDAFSVDLKHALIWVARALDYVGVDDLNHNHRVAYIAYQCSQVLGWEKKKQEFCFLSGLIHDCGVSQTTEHSHLISDMQPSESEHHCHVGFQALEQCELLAQFANIILYHHTDWLHLQHAPISPYEKDVAALIYLADRLDFLRAKYLKNTHQDLITLYKKAITEELTLHKGSLFCPTFVDALITLIHKDGFWFAMDATHIETIPFSFNQLKWLHQDLSLSALTQLGRFIAGIVDAKSPFTYHHSLKVAELSEYLANRMGLAKSTSKLIYVAGLVHDIGKLRTPDEILHKEGPLTENEYIHIRRHTVDTDVALKMIFPNSKLSEWASNHHERLDGSGYPYGKTAEQIDLPSRIIAIADVFQALSQNRPYRSKLSPQEITDIMWPMVTQYKLDADVYDHLARNLNTCYQISIDSSEQQHSTPTEQAETQAVMSHSPPTRLLA
ncbi:TPA: HD domain-containing protein [Vibrio vulnificus]|uniref:HD-GYP domain-containing protein n=1 Tax=Vibrio vulnificus TaxID=672 RepID=UPI000CD16037|nr:HD domain-containing phosphohydrolase [Vibrio vulnificus]EGQ7929410.1 HD domain-containing protein [Vibrio vulnificus]EGQ9969034.1 HD domain-containing protein [Vibrio vulnificus]EHZ2845441.1 HD domain-containing protein [Vibrio vulnificus]EIJ0940452.1 HD domain-containing protein [Vibrio vulnificus]EJT1337214.1 HD domain-containing protein [Vibrio vulnificus]